MRLSFMISVNTDMTGTVALREDVVTTVNTRNTATTCKHCLPSQLFQQRVLRVSQIDLFTRHWRTKSGFNVHGSKSAPALDTDFCSVFFFFFLIPSSPRNPYISTPLARCHVHVTSEETRAENTLEVFKDVTLDGKMIGYV